MRPDFLLVLLTAIIVFSPIGKALAQSMISKNYNEDYQELNKKYLELANKLSEQEDELNKLREIIIFNEEKTLDSKEELDSKIQDLKKKKQKSRFNFKKKI